jgi:hypothetical protein
MHFARSIVNDSIFFDSDTVVGKILNYVSLFTFFIPEIFNIFILFPRTLPSFTKLSSIENLSNERAINHTLMLQSKIRKLNNEEDLEEEVEDVPLFNNDSETDDYVEENELEIEYNESPETLNVINEKSSNIINFGEIKESDEINKGLLKENKEQYINQTDFEYINEN